MGCSQARVPFGYSAGVTNLVARRPAVLRSPSERRPSCSPTTWSTRSSGWSQLVGATLPGSAV